jgi:membrane associated rhomboid family serine protease
VAGDRFAIGLLRQINTNRYFGQKQCPFCKRRMRVFNSQDPPLELDACKPCGVVWFDPQEFETVPEGAPESVNEVRVRATEAFARYRLERLNEQMRREDMNTGDPPDELWKTIPALFGFPVESDVDSLSRKPVATWSVALLTVIASVWAFFDLEPRIQQFGLIPAEFWRYGGFTLISSFFLHGGVWHLVGNLYFFLIFADNVEDYLGRWRFLLMLLLATVTGDCLHALADPRSTIPCVGASGGISGVIVFYALKFPRARLGFLFRYFLYFRWVHIPAWGALVLWLLIQGVGAFQQISGYSNVSSLAHLGGAAVGFLFWLKWRKE